MGPSFGAISAVGPNAASMHYRPDNRTAKVITKDDVYLLDSGGHYLCVKLYAVIVINVAFSKQLQYHLLMALQKINTPQLGNLPRKPNSRTETLAKSPPNVVDITRCQKTTLCNDITSCKIHYVLN